MQKNEFKKIEGLGAGRYQKPVCDGLYFQGRRLPRSHVLFDMIEEDGEEDARVDPADIHVFCFLDKTL